MGFSGNTGGSGATYGYGAFGEPDSWTGSRYRFTGQIMIPEAQLYHFKGRAYDPGLGRFLQSDPIGQAGGVNIYAYAGNDPINFSDPQGLDDANIGAGPEHLTVISSGCRNYCAGLLQFSISNLIQNLGFESLEIFNNVTNSEFAKPSTGHDYKTKDRVCRRPLTNAEAKDLVSRFAVPSVFSGDPVGNGDYMVTNGSGLPGGFVETTFAADGLSGRNTTTPFHAFVGTIVRGVVNSGGSGYVVTHGFGNAGSDPLGRLRDDNNARFGPGIFRQLDRRAAAYASANYSGC